MLEPIADGIVNTHQFPPHVLAEDHTRRTTQQPLVAIENVRSEQFQAGPSHPFRSTEYQQRHADLHLVTPGVLSEQVTDSLIGMQFGLPEAAIDPALTNDALFSWLTATAAATTANLRQTNPSSDPATDQEQNILSPVLPSTPSSSLSTFLGGLFASIDTDEGLADIADWFESCDRCIEQGLDCFIASSAKPGTKACLNCRTSHNKCMVNGVGVCEPHVAFKIRTQATQQKHSSKPCNSEPARASPSYSLERPRHQSSRSRKRQR